MSWQHCTTYIVDMLAERNENSHESMTIISVLHTRVVGKTEWGEKSPKQLLKIHFNRRNVKMNSEWNQDISLLEMKWNRSFDKPENREFPLFYEVAHWDNPTKSFIRMIIRFECNTEQVLSEYYKRLKFITCFETGARSYIVEHKT